MSCISFALQILIGNSFQQVFQIFILSHLIEHSTTLDFKGERTLKDPNIMECFVSEYSCYIFSNLFNNVLIYKKFMWCIWDVAFSMGINLVNLVILKNTMSFLTTTNFLIGTY